MKIDSIRAQFYIWRIFVAYFGNNKIKKIYFVNQNGVKQWVRESLLLLISIEFLNWNKTLCTCAFHNSYVRFPFVYGNNKHLLIAFFLDSFNIHNFSAACFDLWERKIYYWFLEHIMDTLNQVRVNNIKFLWTSFIYITLSVLSIQLLIKFFDLT